MLIGHLSDLALALSIFAVGFVVIGPNILAVIGTSMARGRTDGARLALGIGVGSGVWATLTVVGLAALISTYAGAMVALKLFGAGYLAWMAFKAFRNAARVQDASDAKSERAGNMFRRGLTIQMTNPKAALQWIAITSIGLGQDAPIAVGFTLVIAATLISILGHLAYAYAFSTGPVVRFYDRFRRWLEGALGIFFAFASYKLATARI